MNVSQVYNPYVSTITSGSAVLDAARIMRREHVGSVIVVDGGLTPKPIAILTDRDIVVGMVAPGITDLEALTVDEVCTRELVTIDEFETLGNAAELMKEHGVRRLPVTDREGKLVGILALDDMLGTLAATLALLADTAVGQGTREGDRRE